MSRAGPWCLLLAAACALGRSPPPRAAVRCEAAGSCFSAHLANSSYIDARSDCGRRRGGLAWAKVTLQPPRSFKTVSAAFTAVSQLMEQVQNNSFTV
ncbi:hypothetical protein AV530_010585 [Patagioenas fasciata monilis]|uniref:Uncharacterized protein n=1 Tax=Patagioenas fasciata monilis TaxID=372326 RepID=A0A1V4KFL6_PATFA|nr:hypothetical protein AV530_010585 [Patagioenas fasciata monilis]